MSSLPPLTHNPVIEAVIIAAAILAKSAAADEGVDRRHQRGPRGDQEVIHDGGHSHASAWARSLLHGSVTRFYDLFRMEQRTFCELCRWLRLNTTLPASRYQTVEQKLMIFLYIMGSGEGQRNAAHFFHVSQSSVSGTMQDLFDPMVQLHTAFVTLPEDDHISHEIELDPKSRAFAGCIGALDGTHVDALVPLAQQRRFFNRKGSVTQNVLAVIQFDATFSYVLAGAEGSLHDASLARLALSQSFCIPEGRFYLGDAGFGIQKGILVPYPSVRYHLDDWEHAPNKPATAEELYNLRHARLRIKVEQIFGQVKRKFSILDKRRPEYQYRDQVKIVYAVTGLWNFIQKTEKQGGNELTLDQVAAAQRARETADRVVTDVLPRKLRDAIKDLNWTQYTAYMRASASSVDLSHAAAAAEREVVVM